MQVHYCHNATNLSIGGLRLNRERSRAHMDSTLPSLTGFIIIGAALIFLALWILSSIRGD